MNVSDDVPAVKQEDYIVEDSDSMPPSPPPAVEAPNPPPPSAQSSEEVKLSPEQSQILEIVKGGGNVFFTGPAGEFGRRALVLQCSCCARSTKERGNQLYSGP